MSYQKDGKGAKASNGHSASFRTDSAISSGRPGTERKLQRWMPDNNDTFGQSLESSSGGTWDQFAENERRFGIRTDYDENIYTTSIDKSHPHYKERMAQADKKAREIERSTASTAHVAEERVMDFMGGNNDKDDEEDKYSGVKRQDFPPLNAGASRENKYTPPARRAPTGASNVKGAPVDPAIISSQIKTQKPSSNKPEENKDIKTDPSPAPSAVKPEAKTDSLPRPADPKSSSQSTTPLSNTAAALPSSSPKSKEVNATSTVERDVLKEFKTFATQQRQVAEKSRSNRAKADKEVKLGELRKFASQFKLPTPVPMDLIGIIAKDPARQKEIQQRAQRDIEEVAKKKSDESAKEKKDPAAKDSQSTTPAQTPTDTKASSSSRPNAAPQNSGAAPARSATHAQNARNGFAPNYGGQYMPARPQTQMPSNNARPTPGLAARIRNQDRHNGPASGQDMRMPPTGPANSGGRPGGPHAQAPPAAPAAPKLNPNSHEFRPNPFATSFNPAGASKASSPRTNTNEAPAAAAPAKVVVVSKKRKGKQPKSISVLQQVRSLKQPETKNWKDNGGIRPAFETAPTWRTLADDEKADSTMHLTFDVYLDRHPATAQRTPNPAHVVPQMPHQHQLPFHLQHGAQAHRQGPHAPHVGMQANQHGPIPHGPFNGGDDHRMMPSNSAQSFSSPRMAQVPMAYNSAQMPYNPAMNNFIPGQPHQMNQFNRSFSNNGPYNMQQQQPGAQMMPPQQFMMMAGPIPMYQGHPSFVPPGAAPPQPMHGGNGYPSPGRAAPMMVHQGSQQGQPAMYGVSPSVPYGQPSFAPQQQGPMNNVRFNQGPHQYATTSSQAHGPHHRNGHSIKNNQHHSQNQGPQVNQPAPAAPPARNNDGSDEAK